MNSSPGLPAAPDADTEQRILDAAHRVFVRHGTAGARMQAIAREAGVHHALLHYYFRSKARLAEAVFRRAAGGLFAPLVALLAAEDVALDDKVAGLIALYHERLLAAPFLPGYIIAEVTHHPERAGQLVTIAVGAPPETLRARLLGVLARQIDERVRAGTLRPIAPEQLVLNVLALCIFPFAARPMAATIFGLDDAGFRALVEARRAELPAFVLGALRP